jgi:hypothetical protein
MKYVRLGSGRDISLGRYVFAWKKCLALPADTFIGRGVPGQVPVDPVVKAAPELGERLACGLAAAADGKGRNWSYEWQNDTMQAAARINHPRLIIDWLPPHLKTRFHHRLREAA